MATNKIENSAKMALMLKPLAEAIIASSGNLWTATRDAFCTAATEHAKPEDARSSVKLALKTAGGNDGSIRGYLSTLTWLASPATRDADGKLKGANKAYTEIATLTAIAADTLRYPDKYKQANPEPDKKTQPVEHAEWSLERAEERAASKRESLKKVQAANKPPTTEQLILGRILADLNTLDVDALSAAAVQIHAMVGEMTATPESEERDAQQAEPQQRTGTDG